jgi:DNA-directed RNA polymerase subunit RPC12/RpoP
MWVAMHNKSEQVRKTSHGGGGSASKSKTHGKSKAKGRNASAAGVSDSGACVRVDSESNKFGMFVQSKREAIQENKQCAVLTQKIEQLQRDHDALVARYTLRQKWELKIEIDQLKEVLHKRESGAEEAEFEEILDKYVKAYNSTLFNDTTDPITQCEPESPVTRKRKLGKSAKAAKSPAAVKDANLRGSLAEHPPSYQQTYNRDSLLNELMSDMENKAPPVYVVQGDMCLRCNTPMIILASDALLGCPTCSHTRLYIQATSSRIAYGEEVEFANFSYKRQNHFQEWLNTFQAKESTEVPAAVVTMVMEELYTRKITQTHDITQKIVREILKFLKLRKYYDHSPQITARITGILPPRMTPFQAEQVKLMFSAIQGPFNIHCPPERTNFLSYGYCLFKFCELLGYTDFLPCFTLLKGKDKLACMDRMWKKICDELDWEVSRLPCCVLIGRVRD